MSDTGQRPSGLPISIRPSMILLAVVVILVIVTALTATFVVNQTERAVITRFGRYSRTLGPGLQFKLPLNIEKSYIVETEVFQNMQFGFRTEEAGVVSTFSSVDYPEESIMLTGDLNIVDFEWAIRYRIVDPVAWLFNVNDQQKTIRDISTSVVNQLVGDRAILDVISSAREAIQVDALELMNNKFQEYGLGINVTQIQLQNTRPPEGQVLDAFEDVNIAIQDMNRLINEGKEEYNRVIPARPR
jgi:membrane protease subunit HflK